MDRQTQWLTDGQTDIHSDRERLIYRHRQLFTDRGSHWYTENVGTDTVIDRQCNWQTVTDRQRCPHRDWQSETDRWR